MRAKRGSIRGLRFEHLALVLAAAALAGCRLVPDERPLRLQAVARWEDRRLAPADSLAEFLAADDAHVRLATARAAGLIGRRDAVPLLLPVLADPSSAVRQEAAFALGLLQDAQALPALEQAAVDPHPGVRRAALAALAQLPNPGGTLLRIAVDGEAPEAALAWDALRRNAERVSPAALPVAAAAALGRPEADVRWRVLRCLESAPDTALIPLAAAFARAPEIQVRVHAYRALARLGGPAALAAVLTGAGDHDSFRGRDRQRADIGAARALGALGAETAIDDDDLAATAAWLIRAAGDRSSHVAASALDAMRTLVTERPLPPEAADRESLLPVWRIRLARAAEARLEAPSLGVRTAALAAWADLRGRGATDVLTARLAAETEAPARAACVAALGRHADRPTALLAGIADDPGESPLVRAEALAALAAGPDTLAASRTLVRAAADPDFVVATTAAGLLGTGPEALALPALVALWDRAAGPTASDLRLGVLAGLRARYVGATGPVAAPADSAALAEVRRLLGEAFDAADVRLRLEGRGLAVAGGLLPETLIPEEASLLATLPPVRRAPEQPPLHLPFRAPDVRCRTARGDFVIRLDAARAPNTCAAFLDLIERGFYADAVFHRVVPDFVVQGGDPDGTGWGGPGFSLRSEWSRADYRRGAVGIAHSGKDTGGSQFFVTLSPQPHLNGRYTVFGAVEDGMEVVDRLDLGDRFSLEIVR